ncbi:MAG: FKBP-type peptidyl-prolyl cis-trans isomerase [Candidatus Nanoarchaeia archaeon]
MMASVEQGDKVKVEFEGKLDSGEVFDSSKGEQAHPIEFVVGEGLVIKGFDEAVLGMEEGQEKEFSIKPEDAYGQRREELKKEIPKSSLPKGQEPKEGMALIVQTQQGHKMPVKIDKVKDDSIVLDLNHPLAGQNLNFKIKVVGVESNSK